GAAGLMWQRSIQRSPQEPQPPTSPPAKPVLAGIDAPPARTNLQSTAAPAVEPGTNFSKLQHSIVELNQQALKAMNAGDVQAAIALYEKAVKLAPEDEDLHYNLGIAYAKISDFDKAEQHYREALRLLPDYAEVHNNYGNLLLRAGRLDQAAEQL